MDTVHTLPGEGILELIVEHIGFVVWKMVVILYRLQCVKTHTTNETQVCELNHVSLSTSS